MQSWQACPPIPHAKSAPPSRHTIASQQPVQLPGPHPGGGTQTPPKQISPVAVQSTHDEAPAPQVVSPMDSTQLPFASQQPAQPRSQVGGGGGVTPSREVPPLELVPLGAAPLPELLPVAEPLEVHGALPLDPVAICPSTQTPVPPVPVAGGAPSVR